MVFAKTASFALVVALLPGCSTYVQELRYDDQGSLVSNRIEVSVPPWSDTLSRFRQLRRGDVIETSTLSLELISFDGQQENAAARQAVRDAFTTLSKAGILAIP